MTTDPKQKDESQEDGHSHGSSMPKNECANVHEDARKMLAQSQGKTPHTEHMGRRLRRLSLHRKWNTDDGQQQDRNVRLSKKERTANCAMEPVK